MNFLDDYLKRKNEIENFLLFMEILENKELLKGVDRKSQFDIFFNQENKKAICYGELSNILKSNACLMIYNLIEYTISQLLCTIYDILTNNSFSYVQLNESLQYLWLKNELKTSIDPNVKSDTLHKKTTSIIKKIITDETISLHYRNTISGGNLDLKVIESIFKDHEILFYIPEKIYRPDKFKTLKIHRNNLSHGASLFSKELADNTRNDIYELYKIVVSTLNQLIEDVKNYILLQDFCNENN